jgi:hypothetical protein
LVTPYLGRYSNADLGEVVLKLEGESLILDSSELVMEVLAVADESGGMGAPQGYVVNSYIGPVLGITVQLANDAAGKPQLLLVKGSDEYAFSHLP